MRDLGHLPRSNQRIGQGQAVLFDLLVRHGGHAPVSGAAKAPALGVLQSGMFADPLRGRVVDHPSPAWTVSAVSTKSAVIAAARKWAAKYSLWLAIHMDGRRAIRRRLSWNAKSKSSSS